MKNVVIVGATGATGSQLMQRLLSDDEISQIFVIHYRPTPFKDLSKVREIIMPFDQFDELKLNEQIDCAYCCLGTTRKKAGSLQAFRQVDKDYVLNFARGVREKDIPQLHVISAVGANPTSASSYLKTKGEVEVALRQLNIPRLCLYQPTLLHGKRDEFRLMEALAYYPLSCLSLLPLPFCKQQKPIAVTQLANAMYRTSKDYQQTQLQHEPETEIINSLAIQAF